MTEAYQVDGMHCNACVRKITDALKELVSSVEVTLNPPRAIITGNNIPDLNTLNEAVAKAGNYKLKLIDTIPTTVDESKKSWLKTYYPLLLIIVLISIVSIKDFENWHGWMLNFMAGFFIVFSFFKLLDLKGFRDAYSTYDLLAKHWHGYGLIYPFLELGLGLAFLFRFELITALWFSIALMSFSSLGVIQALSKKQKIRCACLGTVLNLPMSTITLVEDLGMVAMAILMLAGIG